MSQILILGASCRAAAESVFRAGSLNVDRFRQSRFQRSSLKECETGRSLVAFDLFGDRDLMSYCDRIVEIEEYRQVEAYLGEYPDHAVLLAGGVENDFELIERISRTHTILGPNPATLRRLRSPSYLEQTVLELKARDRLGFPRQTTESTLPITTRSVSEGSIAGSPSLTLRVGMESGADRPESPKVSKPGVVNQSELELQRASTGGDSCKQWLVKPIDSAGGLRIDWFLAEQANNETSSVTSASNIPTRSVGEGFPPITTRSVSEGPSKGLSPAAGDGFVLQEWIEGMPVGIVFGCLNGQATVVGCVQGVHGAEQLGVPQHRVLIGLPAGPFVYRGSRGPISLAESLVQVAEALTSRLLQGSGYSGLLQADFILSTTGSSDGEPKLYLLEVNPRWSAGMEVLEIAFGSSLFELHEALFYQGNSQAVSEEDVHQMMGGWGRAGSATVDRLPMVVKEILYSACDFTVSERLSDWLWQRRQGCWFADIPRSGAKIVKGSPVATVLWKGARDVDPWREIGSELEELERVFR